MVFVCMVKGCNNSKKLTMKKCKRFRIPRDELRRKNWLINCSRQDLLGKSTSYHVCSDHFEAQMYRKPDRKVLLPTAVPTDFSMIFKKDTCSTSCRDASISDPLLFKNSVATSTPLKQEESISNSCSSSSSSQSFKETDITELINLGFSREQVIQELKRFIGNKNQAMASLFAKILKF
ncbi:52 kDa repressor of the inhibitor of the protein kinase-like [Metopolophium dirhodum]|uniref:52 kDa repressor of the inhibitor of the protein kinase-like n=1 Tax=Metopolophium dirhodum TaxID=44670 RepID=UPI00299002BE|nr:52 kDa repressor of the inhibitor of the protein kinase-like [Metopolophium dirhodum]